MKGLKALAAVLVATGLLASVIPASASAAAYKHYVACGVENNSKPAHACPKNSKKGAFFESVGAEVNYTVCVRFPSGKNLCAKAQPAEEGVLYVNKITSTIPGKHQVTWFVKGKKVGTFVFRVQG
jgi:hypothetical protein